MRKHRLAWGAGLGAVGAIAPLLFAAACGSRTGLLVDDAIVQDDAMARDSHLTDAPRDRDALPLLDVRPAPDVVRNDCPDAAATLIYVITAQDGLWSFNPSSGAFTRIGTISCPAPPGGSPFSMAVDRKGIAYVVFSDAAGGGGNGMLFRVSTATAACVATPYTPGQQGIKTFGMGFASNTNGPQETLYIASDDAPARLGTIDVTTFALNVVGPFAPQMAELTGTGDGRLFAFYQRSSGVGSAIGQIDKQTAQLVAETPLPTVERGNHWAFGFWGGDFYIFTGPQGAGTDVTRFRPADTSVTIIAHLGEEIVGAGVSTCAPEQ